MKYDFAGWATKANLRCGDGLVIGKDAFKNNDGQKVPLVWNHEHNDPNNVLGHALLANRADGVYAYCTFNNTPSARNAKEMVQHGDIDALSIYANRLEKKGNYVQHGVIREVSLVLAGCNPGAYIDEVISHGELIEDAGVIFTGEPLDIAGNNDIQIIHKDTKKEEVNKMDNKSKEDSSNDKTIQEIFDSLSEEQKDAVYTLVGIVLDEKENNNSEGEDKMKHNVFNQDKQNEGDVLSHSEIKAIFEDGKRYGSLKDAVLAHGVTNIDYLFPDAKNVNDVPDFIKRDTGWVSKVLGSVHHTPFSRIKSVYANITEEDARAKGYMKGNLKKDEVFSLLKRTTSPTTIYKKQKLDRDDAVDITDFDVVGWLKAEMRMMLDEEIARALLIGDGRLSSSDDKINEQNIRPIWKDEELYTIKAKYDVKGLSEEEAAKTFIKNAIKARKNYKGSGSPVLYTTEDMLTAMLLIEDTTGRIIYDSVQKLCSQLRVSDIITVPVMEGQTRQQDGVTYTLDGIIVNLVDYNIGADKGGAVNMFDDFDIDYNAQKYLIETRCSGALIKPYAAIAIESFKSA